MKSETSFVRKAIALLIFSGALSNTGVERAVAADADPAQSVVDTAASANVTAPVETEVVTADLNPSEVPSRFAGTAQVGYSTETFPDEVVVPESSIDYLLLLSYQLRPEFKLGLRVEGSQDQKNSQNSQFTLARLSLSYQAIALGTYLKMVPSVRWSFPVKSADLEDTSFKGGASLASVLALDTAALGDESWRVELGLSAGKNIHQFETDVNGISNLSESYSAGLTLEKRLGRFVISAVGSYLYGLPYLGERRQQFELTEELGYDLSEKISLALGHTNLGNAFAADGETSLVKLSDPMTSMSYLSLAIGL